MTASSRRFMSIIAATLAVFSVASASPFPPLPFLHRSQAAPAITLSQAERALETGGATFIENKGQWDRQVKFLLKSPGLDMWITERGVRYDLFSLTSTEKTMENDRSRNNERRAVTRTGHVVGISFEGAAFAPTARGIRQQPGAHNYFIGNDPAKWASGVRHFAQSRLDNLYDGIDALFYLDEGRPRYDLIVQPGADPGQVQMKIEGSNGVSISSDGSLAIQTMMGVLQQQGLYAYQEIDGVQRQVQCRFAVDAENRVRFDLGSYDRSRVLVIDPLVYSTYLGSSGSDHAAAIAVDNGGNAYITGNCVTTNFPMLNQYQDNQGLTDVVVTKLGHTGSGKVTLIYSTYLGGNNYDFGHAIAVDVIGNAYVTGYTTRGTVSFPTLNDFESNGGGDDVFISKLVHNGNGNVTLDYSVFLGGGNDDVGEGIAVDSDGTAYVTGYTRSSSFTTKNQYQTDQPLDDAFVAKLIYFGSGDVVLGYSTYLGGESKDEGAGIAVDGIGNVYVTGYAASPDFPMVNQHLPHNTWEDVFVTKLAPHDTGSVTLLYSTFLGGSADDFGRGIAVDDSGNAYVTGYTASSDFPTSKRYQGYGGEQDAFVAKFTHTGNGNVALAYSTFIGGDGEDDSRSIAVTGFGNVYITGYTSSSNFPTSPQQQNLATDGFITRLTQNSTGRVALVFSTFLGGSGMDFAYGIAVDGDGNAYVAGQTQSLDFPILDQYQSDRMSDDAFVAKYSFDPKLNVPLTPVSNSSIQLALTPNPAHDNLSCSFTLARATSVTIQIYSADGRLASIPVQSGSYEPGNHSRNIPVAELATGVYTLRMITADGSYVAQFVVMR